MGRGRAPTWKWQRLPKAPRRMSTKGLVTIINTREPNVTANAKEMTSNIDAKEMDGTTKTSLAKRGVDTRIKTNKAKPYRGDVKEDNEETYTKHQSWVLQDGKPIKMHIEDIANAENEYTREEIYSRVYDRVTKYNNSRRHKTSHMTKGNNDKINANKDNQSLHFSPGDEGQHEEGSTREEISGLVYSRIYSRVMKV